MDDENEENWLQRMLGSVGSGEDWEQRSFETFLGQYAPDNEENWVQRLLNTGDASTGGGELGEGVSSGVPRWDSAQFIANLPSWVPAGVKSLLSGAKDVVTSRAGMAGLMALLSATDRARPSGGGYTQVASPTPTNRTMVQGKYGPIAQYAAQGGLMHAYAHGGAVTGTHKNPLRMEDGGFVMTKRAVDGAGGPRGIAQMLPGARPIVGPGTGTSDHIPATIDGNTPARVSNGEAYVPKAVVDREGGAKALYALMNQLQRRA